MNSNELVVTLENGEEKKFKIVATITDKIENKNYIYFTDTEENESETETIYGALIYQSIDGLKIEKDITEKDYTTLREIFSIIKDVGEDDSTSVNITPYVEEVNSNVEVL